MRKRGESERLRRSTVPGFAVPWRMLSWLAVVWATLFGASLCWLCVVAWPANVRPVAMIAGAPFLVSALLGACLMAWSGDALSWAVRGARIVCGAVVAAGVALAGAAFIGAGAWGPFPEVGLMVLVVWSFLVLAPLVTLARRLALRAAAGDPAWHPHMATGSQRGDAVLAFCTAVGAVSGGLVMFVSTVLDGGALDPDAFLHVGWVGALGFVIGAVVGSIPGAWLSVYLNDRNLARCLPPITIAAPLTGMAGALIGPGWGVLGVAAAILVVGTVMGRRHKIFEPHRCQSCGYHLTGLSGGVCPECGTGRGQA